jgi:hypothetical protein
MASNTRLQKCGQISVQFFSCEILEVANKMELLEPIESQLISNRLPLVAVTVAAVPCANTPIVLGLHWHGFVEVKLVDIADAQTLRYDSVPSSALQINDRWDDFAQLDDAALRVAWELGAWDIARHDAPPVQRAGARAFEAMDCMTAFGFYPYQIDGSAPFVAEVPDADELMELAAKRGYIKWQFRPVRGGIWKNVSDDVTLEEGGYRNGPCPRISSPSIFGKARRMVYRLGRSRREAE